MNKNIAFFGDSFCSVLKDKYSIENNYQTYIEKVSISLDANIVNLGVDGSNIWDVVLIQMPEVLKKIKPDVCIFVWTDPSRIFNRTHRNLNSWIIQVKEFKNTNRSLHNAVTQYYNYLYDEEKHNLEARALLYYFDNEIISKMKGIKFIHFWSFENSVCHRWSTGVEIRPSLEIISRWNNGMLAASDARTNHIEGDEKNNLIKNLIINATETYQDNRLINFTANNL